MATPDSAWFDAQYNNRARVPEAAELMPRWAQASSLVRGRMTCELDVPYGPGAGETLDVFPAKATGAPVLLFIHGGYWRALDKSDVSFVAPAYVQAGAMVVVPNYALCPAVGVEHIAVQCAQALAWVWRHAARYGGDASRIIVAGHSAGGHLAAMLQACDGRKLAADLPAKLAAGGLSLSGLFDLDPIRRTPFLQGDLKLTPASVRRLSPVNFPRPGSPLVALVGGDESDEFLRQNQLIRHHWGKAAVPVCEALPGLNHFTVMHDFVDPAARAHQHALALLGLG